MVHTPKWQFRYAKIVGYPLWAVFFFLRVPVFQTNPYATLTKKRKDFEPYQYPENPIVECMGQNIYVWDPKVDFIGFFH